MTANSLMLGARQGPPVPLFLQLGAVDAPSSNYHKVDLCWVVTVSDGGSVCKRFAGPRWETGDAWRRNRSRGSGWKRERGPERHEMWS